MRAAKIIYRLDWCKATENPLENPTVNWLPLRQAYCQGLLPVLAHKYFQYGTAPTTPHD